MKHKLTTAFVVLAILCLGLVIASWLRNIDTVIGQLGDNPDWRVILCPRGYFLGLYVVEMILIVAAIWAYKRNKKVCDPR